MKPILLFLFLSVSALAQQTFYLKDKATDSPIAYASIYNDKGTFKINSESDGSFIIPDEFKNDTFIIESIGYELIQTNLENSVIYLNDQSETLEEMIIIPKLGTKEIKVGIPMKNENYGFMIFSDQNVKASTYFGNKYTIDSQKFLFIREVNLKTRSKVNNAKFAIRIYDVNEIGEPGQLLHDEPIYGIAKKGKTITNINLENLNLQLTSKEFFVFFEPLFIKENHYTEKDSKGTSMVFYYPSLAMAKNEENSMWIGSKLDGEQKWTISESFIEYDNREKGYHNYQIEVILTN